jgi:cobalt-zinc-cadmium efflux system outer membrane protein
MTTSGWLLVSLLCGALSGAPGRDAGEPLTEQEVVTRALERRSFVDAIEGKIATEEGRTRSSDTRNSPQITYLREQTFGNAGTGEDYLSVAHTIRLGYRPRVRAAGGEAREGAARQRGEAVRVEGAAVARERFYGVMHRELRLAALQSWIDRIDEMLAIVARREARGDAAAYDRRRLERERAVAVARVDTELAALERAQARLAAILGEPDVHVRVSGTMLPETAPDPLAQLRRASTQRPDLRALDLLADAARHDLDALSRAWMPDLRLEAGWKGVGAPGQPRADGFMAAGMLSFPPRGLAAGLRRQAEGEARAARGERALLLSELEGEIAGARAEAVRLRDGAIAFREQAVAASQDLVRISTAGYQGGELGLLEVLDAYRGAVDDAMTTVDMEHAARRARIELERLTGGSMR